MQQLNFRRLQELVRLKMKKLQLENFLHRDIRPHPRPNQPSKTNRAWVLDCRCLSFTKTVVVLRPKGVI